MNFFSATRTLYSSNIPNRKRNPATPCENEMALKVDYEQLLEDQKDPNVLIVDVRAPDEIKNTGELPGSINVPCKNLIVYKFQCLLFIFQTLGNIA